MRSFLKVYILFCDLYNYYNLWSFQFYQGEKMVGKAQNHGILIEDFVCLITLFITCDGLHEPAPDNSTPRLIVEKYFGQE